MRESGREPGCECERTDTCLLLCVSHCVRYLFVFYCTTWSATLQTRPTPRETEAAEEDRKRLTEQHQQERKHDQEEIHHLRDETRALRKENANLRDEVSRLESQVLQLQDELSEAKSKAAPPTRRASVVVTSNVGGRRT